MMFDSRMIIINPMLSFIRIDIFTCLRLKIKNIYVTLYFF